MPNTLKRFEVRWAPTGALLVTVRAIDEREARRAAPMPYRKYLGEVYAREVGEGACALCRAAPEVGSILCFYHKEGV